MAGYAWAALMFALGAGTIAVALTGDIKLWAIYVSVVAVGAKIAAFAVQYVAFRILVDQPVPRRPRLTAASRREHYWACTARCAIPPPSLPVPGTIPVLRRKL